MTYSNEQELKVSEIQQEIFRLIKQAPDLDTVHWYCWLDNCFENGYLHTDEIGNIKWRCRVLAHKKEPINKLACLIDEVAKLNGVNLNDD